MDELQAAPDEVDQEKSAEIPIVDTAMGAPIIYADAMIHVSALAGVVRLAFAQNIGNPPNGLEPGWKGRHCAVIAMPAGNLPHMVDRLQQAIDDLKALGWFADDGK